jgi:hypothetical protein
LIKQCDRGVHFDGGKVGSLKMSRLFYTLVLLYAMTWSTYSITPGNFFHSAGTEIIAAIGGKVQFDDEVLSAAANASALRDGIPVSVVDLRAGAGGVLSKLCFQYLHTDHNFHTGLCALWTHSLCLTGESYLNWSLT